MDLIPSRAPAASVHFPNFPLYAVFEKVQVKDFLGGRENALIPPPVMVNLLLFFALNYTP